MPVADTSSCSSFWLSPVMPCSSASTSSCERICWFIALGGSRLLDDEVREVHGRHRQRLGAPLLLLLRLVAVGLLVVLVVVDVVAHRARGFAPHLLGELVLAFAVHQLRGGLLAERHEDVVADRRHVGLD